MTARHNPIIGELRVGDKVVALRARIEFDACARCGAWGLINRGWGACDDAFACFVRQEELKRMRGVRLIESEVLICV